MPNYNHYEERVKNTPTKYMKGGEKQPYTCEECTCKFIKPRTDYDKMMNEFISGKPLILPNVENLHTNN